MLQFLHEKTIRFNGSILGFEQLDGFSVSVVEENSPYAYLQSLEEENIGFLVVTPFVFYPDYEFELEEKDKSLLELKSQEEGAVLAIVTMSEDFIQSTVNLLAPLMINITNGLARQVVLPPKFNYGTKELLFKQAMAEKGE
ncbi:flagellar assembly protein FliW [Ferviditalea candida]|uniref:Flagellar assembly factor FliW n=1 Tax=Ferviditalea candida TaxID=3108399 RepID=A0ABU5ZIR8_9BACL|nr:flagellar assembly protein FliW [Paenibacillaceae bacterium T2]